MNEQKIKNIEDAIFRTKHIITHEKIELYGEENARRELRDRLNTMLENDTDTTVPNSIMDRLFFLLNDAIGLMNNGYQDLAKKHVNEAYSTVFRIRMNTTEGN